MRTMTVAETRGDLTVKVISDSGVFGLTVISQLSFKIFFLDYIEILLCILSVELILQPLKLFKSHVGVIFCGSFFCLNMYIMGEKKVKRIVDAHT